MEKNQIQLSQVWIVHAYIMPLILNHVAYLYYSYNDTGFRMLLQYTGVQQS